jgi:nucleoside-diphosphate-sugar epimerase
VRTVVTGAAGFIGSHLVRELLRRSGDVIGIDCFSTYYDPDRKRANVADFIDHHDFTLVDGDLNGLDLPRLLGRAEVVYHLAGQPGVRASWGDEFEIYLEQNLLATQKLLEAAKELPLRRFVVASSSSIYGDAERFPTKESDVPQPVSPYGVTKLAVEHLCHLYRKAFGVPYVLLRYFSIFGPRQRPDMAFSRFIAAALANRPLKILGDGGQSRDFTYVGDAVAATIEAGAKGEPGSTYNIAGGCQATVLEVVKTLEQLLERPLEREHVEPVPGDPRKTGADISAAKQDLDYEPTVPLEQGLANQLEHARTASA